MTGFLDLDALEREQKREPFRFKFDGRFYELAPTLDIRAAVALDAGRLEEALRRLLGDDQWDQLMATPKVFDQDMLWAILENYATHLGMDLGNSSASSGSPLPTRVPSNPTYKGSTPSTLAG